jgi:hypothetical protein
MLAKIFFTFSTVRCYCIRNKFNNQTLTPKNSSARAIPPNIAASSPSLEATIFKLLVNIILYFLFRPCLQQASLTGLNNFILSLFYKYAIPNGIKYFICKTILLFVPSGQNIYRKMNHKPNRVPYGTT